jgi:hypothetical protein
VNDLPQNKARLLATAFHSEFEAKRRSRKSTVPSFGLQKNREDGAERQEKRSRRNTVPSFHFQKCDKHGTLCILPREAVKTIDKRPDRNKMKL